MTMMDDARAFAALNRLFAHEEDKENQALGYHTIKSRMPSALIAADATVTALADIAQAPESDEAEFERALGELEDASQVYGSLTLSKRNCSQRELNYAGDRKRKAHAYVVQLYRKAHQQ